MLQAQQATLSDLEECRRLIDLQNKTFAEVLEPVGTTAVERMLNGYFPVTHNALLKNNMEQNVAFASIHGEDVRRRFYVDAFADPSAQAHEDLVDYIVGWCSQNHPGWDIHVMQNQRVQPTCAALDARGFVVNTTYWTLSVDLPSGLEQPELPDGISIRAISSDEDIFFWYQINQDAFSQHDGWAPITFEQFKEWNLGSPSEDKNARFLLFTGDHAVGYVEGTNYRANLNHGYVDSIAVIHQWHGHGYGHLLLRTAMAYYSRLGRSALDLNADSANSSGALGLYRGVGMKIVESKDEYVLRSAR